MAFAYYKTVTLTHTQSGATDLTDWPLTIGLGVGPQAADADLKTVGNSGFVQSATGYDIRPYANSTLTTPLAFQLVFYNGATGALELHVKIPTVSHTVDTVIYLAFGDAGLTTDGSTTAAWNANYGGVWHFANGTTLALTDATSNANHGTGVNTPTAGAGDLDGGLVLNGTSQVVTVPDAASLRGTQVTLSAWAKFTGTIGAETVAGKSTNGPPWVAPQTSWLIWTTGPTTAQFIVGIAGSLTAVSTGITLAVGTWYLLALTYDGAAIVAYQNGAVLNAAAVTGPISYAAGPLIIGGDYSVVPYGEYFAGTIDEVRVMTTAASADWLLADYNSQKASSTFVTWGTKTVAPSGGGTGTHQFWLTL